MRPILLVLVFTGCNPGENAGSTPADDDTEAGDVDTGSTTDTDTDTDTAQEPASRDPEVVASLLAGEITVGEALSTVADGDGWPVDGGDGTFWFVAEDLGQPVSLAGDHNDWALTPMQAADGYYWAQVDISEPLGSGYKFVRPEDDYVPDPWARHYAFDAFGELSLVRPDPGDAHYARLLGVRSSQLTARMVRVRVPAGEGPWPVLYVQDGQNLFEQGGAFGSWNLQDNAQSDSMLIVGIDSTADRMSEYTHVDDTVGDALVTAQGDRTGDLVRDVVRPRIEAEWGTTGHDGLMGSSLGGLISLHIAQRQPGDWDYVASLSGTLGWGRFAGSGPVMQELYAGRTDLGGLVVYVDSGGSDGGDGCTDPDQDGFVEDDPNDADNFCMNRAFADALAADGFVWEDTLFHWHALNAPHSEAAWADRVSRPLQHFLDSAP